MCCNAEQESKKAKRTVKSNEVKKFIYLLFLNHAFFQCSPWILGMTKYKSILEQGGLFDDKLCCFNTSSRSVSHNVWFSTHCVVRLKASNQ